VRLQTEGKLNQLHRILPEGLIVDSSWLQRKGYSRSLISKYLRSGWLESPTYGVYRRPASAFDQKSSEKWQLLVLSLQRLHDLPLSIGGRTALELHGYAHYLQPTGPREIHLYGTTPLPRWVTRFPNVSRVIFHRALLFRDSPDCRGLGRTKPGEVSQSGITNAHYSLHPWGAWEWPIVLSTPERAVFELLEEVPQRETFDQADALIQGLANLSPRRLNTLLASCHSIKVKRLFLWFAERHRHPWFDALDLSRIDLGTGKRMLVRGGKLDPKYLITVPEDLSREL
jgi:hypothetical protein